VSLYESYGAELGLRSALDKLELHQGDGGESQVLATLLFLSRRRSLTAICCLLCLFFCLKGRKIKQYYSPFIHVFERAGWCSNSREELATNHFQVAPKTFNPVTKRWYQCGIQSRQSIFLLYIEPQNSVPHPFGGIQS
jgi:hypothetical protein